MKVKKFRVNDVTDVEVSALAGGGVELLVFGDSSEASDYEPTREAMLSLDRYQARSLLRTLRANMLSSAEEQLRRVEEAAGVR